MVCCSPDASGQYVTESAAVYTTARASSSHGHGFYADGLAALAASHTSPALPAAMPGDR